MEINPDVKVPLGSLLNEWVLLWKSIFSGKKEGRRGWGWEGEGRGGEYRYMM